MSTYTISWPLRRRVSASLLFLYPYSYHISVTFSSTILKKSSKPLRMPANSLLLFIIIHSRSPMHLSRSVRGIILIELIDSNYYKISKVNKFLLILICEVHQRSHFLVLGHIYYLTLITMSTPGSKIEMMLSRPIEHLVMRQKRLPNIEVIRLYREVYKHAAKFDWYNEKRERWTDIIRKSARKEFDLSKYETDPFLVMKMMVTTRECLGQLDEKLCSAHMAFVKNLEQTKNEEEFLRR